MAKTKFRPLHDRVVVKRIDAEEKSKGGIIIPDTAKEKPSQGQVVAVGPGGRDESGKVITPDVKAGDKVLFGKWSGTEVVLDGEDSPDHEGVRHHGRHRLTTTNANSARSFVPSSCAGLTRASIIFARRWIAGSSPAMTAGGSRAFRPRSTGVI